MIIYSQQFPPVKEMEKVSSSDRFILCFSRFHFELNSSSKEFLPLINSVKQFIIATIVNCSSWSEFIM